MRRVVVTLAALAMSCAEPVEAPPPPRDGGARPPVSSGTDGGGGDAGTRSSPRDAGTTDSGDDGLDAGLIIEEPLDGGGADPDAGCSCALKLARPDRGGVFVGGLTIGCGWSACSVGGVLDFGCDAQGVPTLPDCPTQHACVCTISPGHRMRCGTSACGGPAASQTGYVCSATGQLSGPSSCP